MRAASESLPFLFVTVSRLPFTSNMKSVALLAILFGITLTMAQTAVAQGLSPLDQEKLKLGGAAADRFVERFQQTRDFGIVWKEFHMSDVSCTIKANGVFSKEDYERLKLEDELLERFYVAIMNYYYLKAVHDFYVVGPDLEFSEEALTPKEILRAEKKSTYVKTNGKEPGSAKEIEKMILELRRLARLYRKHTPPRAMSSPAWREKMAYLERKNVPASERIMNGDLNFCIPENVKVYIVERGIFYFYFVEEKGSMKVAGLGIGN